MPVPFVRCRNEVTGATAEIPETALPHLTDWVPDQPDTDTTDGDAAPAASEPEPASRTTKRKAVEAATEKRD